MKTRTGLLLATLLALCLSTPALAQEGAATLPEGPGWAAEAWRTWCGIAGVMIIAVPLVTNTIEPLIRNRWPLLAQRIRQLAPLALALFMSRSFKDALRALVVGATEALKPGTSDTQTAVVRGVAKVTVSINSDGADAPKSKPTILSSGAVHTIGAPASLMILCLAIVGCAGLSPELAGQIGKATAAVGKADAAAMAIYTREQEECDDDRCMRETRAEWEPIIEAFAEVRRFWCLVKPEDCAPVDAPAKDGAP